MRARDLRIENDGDDDVVVVTVVLDS